MTIPSKIFNKFLEYINDNELNCYNCFYTGLYKHTLSVSVTFSVVKYINNFLGNYFGSHFIMGGERFDTPQPEAYLFGENADLNFLGSRPTPVSYNLYTYIILKCKIFWN